MSAVFGYFDPGAGSLVLQALVGGAGGILVLARYAWTVIRDWRQQRRLQSACNVFAAKQGA